MRVFGAGLACACVSMRVRACFVGQLPVRARACFHIALALALRGLPGRACVRACCIYAKRDLMALRILFGAFIVDGNPA